jgi:EmrB/QacA subfamily drug resistance transporter
VLLVVSSGVFLSSLDQFIVNVAFPAIGQEFAPVSRASLSWVLTGYTIGFAALLAPAGRLADRFGRRRLFLSGMVVFTAASAAAGASWNVESLVAFRVIQSTGAAMVMGTSLALLLHAFPPGRRAFAISVWSAVGAIAATCGPTIGGLLVQSSWRWIFLVNLPVGLAAMLVGRRVLTESRDAEETRWPDFVGTLLLVAGVAGVTLGLVLGADRGYRDPVVVSALAGGAVALVATVVRAAWTPARLVPVLPLPLFRVRTFAAANLAMTTFMIAFGALMLGNVLFFTEIWHLPSVRIGMYLLPAPAIAALVAVPGGWLGHRLGHGPVATFGVALYGFGCLWFANVLGPSPEYVRDFLPGQVICGIGVGLTFTNFASAVSSTLPPAWLASGSATLSAARQIGTVFGVALLFAVIGTTAGGPLAPFRRAWLVMATVSGLASLTAAIIGQARGSTVEPDGEPAVELIAEAPA